MSNELAIIDNDITPILHEAVKANTSIEVIKELIALKIGFDKHLARQEFFRDLAAAKKELPSFVNKEKTVDFTTGKGRTRYNYESLASISKNVNPILSGYGLSIVYDVNQESNKVTVACKVCHRSGHVEQVSMSSEKDTTGNKNTLQQIGSTVSYLMRYTLKLSLGISAGDREEDDDAHGSELSVGDKERIFNEAKILVDNAESKEELQDIWRSAKKHGLEGSVMLVHLAKACTEREKQLMVGKVACPNGGNVRAGECGQCGSRAGCPAWDDKHSETEAKQPQSRKGTPPPTFS